MMHGGQIRRQLGQAVPVVVQLVRQREVVLLPLPRAGLTLCACTTLQSDYTRPQAVAETASATRRFLSVT